MSNYRRLWTCFYVTDVTSILLTKISDAKRLQFSQSHIYFLVTKFDGNIHENARIAMISRTEMNIITLLVIRGGLETKFEIHLSCFFFFSCE